MTSLTVDGVTTNLTYNSRNQIETPGTNVFDAKGQTTDQDGRTFEWDEQGRVVAIVQGTHRSEFEYDGMSRRLDAPCGCTAIVEIENGTTQSRKLYWWLGGTIVCERDGLQPGFPITKRYFGQGVEDNGVKLYYTLDHLGSVQELTDATGEVVADYRYTVYGERTKNSGPQDSDFGFAGLFHHTPSGLDLATYRLYDARQRRFISRDPLGEAVDYNLYRYANNNPVMYTDPSGLLTGNQDLLNRLDHYVARNKTSYGSGEALLNGAVARANKILRAAEMANRGNTKHQNTARQVIKGVQKTMNDPNYIWGYDGSSNYSGKHGKDQAFAYTNRAEPYSDGTRSRLTELGVRDITPNLSRQPCVDIEEVLAAFIIHEAFHAYRGNLLATTGQNRYQTSDHGPSTNGPLFWFTRGVLGPHWNPIWRSPWTGPMIP